MPVVKERQICLNLVWHEFGSRVSFWFGVSLRRNRVSACCLNWNQSLWLLAGDAFSFCSGLAIIEDADAPTHGSPHACSSSTFNTAFLFVMCIPCGFISSLGGMDCTAVLAPSHPSCCILLLLLLNSVRCCLCTKSRCSPGLYSRVAAAVS